MTKEQEVIKYIETRIKICNENADICDDNDFDEEATYLREESYMLETVLSMLKQKDKEIEKKDKIIDLMAEYINHLSDELVQTTGRNELEFCNGNKCCKDSEYSCEQCIKQYYERKSKE